VLPIRTILLVLALVCFLVSAFGYGSIGKCSLTPLGLFFWVFAVLLQ
jgi:hypothetical protein